MYEMCSVVNMLHCSYFVLEKNRISAIQLTVKFQNSGNTRTGIFFPK